MRLFIIYVYLQKGDNMNDTMTEREAAAYLGLSHNTLRTWRCTKKVEIPYVKIGKAVRYRKNVLDFFLDKCVVLPKGR